MKQIKTFEDACKKLGIDPTNLPEVSNLTADLQQAVIDHYKMMIVSQALNDGWKPDWNDHNQRKWNPWFTVKASSKNPGGSGLVCSNALNWITGTGVGSRLCFRDAETAEYAGRQFKKLYEGFWLIK